MSRGKRKVTKRKVKRRKRKGGRLPSILPGEYTGGGLSTLLSAAAKIGFMLGKDKNYKRMGAKGVTGSYKRNPAPWEV